MLEYEWAKPSTIMLSSEGTVQESNQNRQIFYPYSVTQTAAETATFLNPNPHITTAATSHHQHPFHHTEPLNTQLTNLYDPRVYGSSLASSYPAEASMLGLESSGPTGYMLMPKSEPVFGGVDFNSNASRIGLNLGGRTYFASSEDDSVNRLYRRFRAVESGLVNVPRCQAEGCRANLAHAKHYHRRHKVCEFHSKASTVITAGLTQRFCQQCSRFHTLSEFDNGKRSCRKRLSDHNRRRRKSQQSNQELNNKSQHVNAGHDSSSENRTRSPPESGVHSSSITAAISSPNISLDCFRQRPSFRGATTISSTASTSSLSFTKK